MSNDSGSSQLRTENQVLFESNRCLEAKDIDILSLFLENKRQSGGGDILRIVPVKGSKSALTVFYEAADVQQRILSRRFLRFQEYLLRASEQGYKSNQLYSLDTTKIILENVSSDEQELVIQMYAEYLLPANTVLEIIQMQLHPNTYCVCYEEPVDMELLQTRYNKRTHLRSRHVGFWSAYKTDALLVKAPQGSDTSMEQIQQLLDKNFPQTLKTDTMPFMFLETLGMGPLVLCQFEDSNVELLARILLEENGFVVDRCYNFDFVSVERLQTESTAGLSRGAACYSSTDKDGSAVMLCDRAVQTELDPSKTVRQQRVQASINSITEKFSSLKSSSPPTGSPKSSNSTASTNFINNNNNNNNKNVLTLDPLSPYTITLINSTQTLSSFQEHLQTKSKGSISLSLVELDKSNFQLLAVSQQTDTASPDWKGLFANELDKFFSSKATHRVVKIPDEILQNQSSMDILHATSKELNRTCSAVYFTINGAEIHGYGLRKFVQKQLDSIPMLFRSLMGEQPKESKLYGSDLAVLIDSNSILNCVLSNCKSILSDFRKNVKELGAGLVTSTRGNEQSYRIECLKENADPIAWTKGVYGLVENYEASRLKLKKLVIPPNLRKEREMNDLIKHLELNFKLPVTNLFYTITKDSVNVQGYTSCVKAFTDSVHSKFNNLKNNIKDRCKRKLDVRLDEFKCPNIVVLGNANGHFLKEFSNQLFKHEALVELLNPSATKIKITCEMLKRKLNNEDAVDAWRKNVDQIVVKYFDKFQVDRVCFKREHEKSFSMLLADFGVHTKLKVNWIDDNCVQIIGLESDITMVKSALSKNQVNDKSKKETKSLKIIEPNQLESEQKPPIELTDSPAEETFQISDLKWFQTRMLFERKYFQFISETYPRLNVMIDTNLTHIWYKGHRQDIDEVKSLAFAILDKILGTEVEADHHLLAKMAEREAELEGIFKQNGLCCIVDSKSDTNKFTIYGTTAEEIGQCKFILSEITF